MSGELRDELVKALHGIVPDGAHRARIVDELMLTFEAEVERRVAGAKAETDKWHEAALKGLSVESGLRDRAEVAETKLDKLGKWSLDAARAQIAVPTSPTPEKRQEAKMHGDN